MIPALILLKVHGSELGLSKPWEMFWGTGILSSFLDNTPTYMVFLQTAGALGETTGIHTTVGIVSQIMLEAISAGAVFNFLLAIVLFLSLIVLCIVSTTWTNYITLSYLRLPE